MLLEKADTWILVQSKDGISFILLKMYAENKPEIFKSI